MVSKYLPVIDSRRTSWKAQVDRQILLGSNFLFILDQSNPELLSSLGIADFEKLHNLDVPDLLPLLHYLHPRALDILKAALAERALIHFVNQLQFPPQPDFHGYLLYCKIRGIISRHSNLSEARESCLHRYQQLLLEGEFPEVGVYEWRGQMEPGRWVGLFTPSAEAWLKNEKPLQTSLEAAA